MGVYYETIPDSLRPWIMEQEMLWVYASPLPHPFPSSLTTPIIYTLLTSIQRHLSPLRLRPHQHLAQRRE
jgi:hypothetical protein